MTRQRESEAMLEGRAELAAIVTELRATKRRALALEPRLKRAACTSRG
jgi:hypothetical protein